MVLETADAARTWLLKHVRVTQPFVRSRDLRVVAAAILACVTALATTVGAPGYVLLIGPVILGMPHLVFEARYLFFQHVQLRRIAPVAIVIAQTASVFAGTG